MHKPLTQLLDQLRNAIPIKHNAPAAWPNPQLRARQRMRRTLDSNAPIPRREITPLDSGTSQAAPAPRH